MTIQSRFAACRKQYKKCQTVKEEWKTATWVKFCTAARQCRSASVGLLGLVCPCLIGFPFGNKKNVAFSGTFWANNPRNNDNVDNLFAHELQTILILELNRPCLQGFPFGDIKCFTSGTFAIQRKTETDLVSIKIGLGVQETRYKKWFRDTTKQKESVRRNEIRWCLMIILGIGKFFHWPY